MQMQSDAFFAIISLKLCALGEGIMRLYLLEEKTGTKLKVYSQVSTLRWKKKGGWW